LDRKGGQGTEGVGHKLEFFAVGLSAIPEENTYQSGCVRGNGKGAGHVGGHVLVRVAGGLQGAGELGAPLAVDADDTHFNVLDVLAVGGSHGDVPSCADVEGFAFHHDEGTLAIDGVVAELLVYEVEGTTGAGPGAWGRLDSFRHRGILE
jgi:hypothetical protein